jgi:hypothetical protein
MAALTEHTLRTARGAHCAPKLRMCAIALSGRRSRG